MSVEAWPDIDGPLVGRLVTNQFPQWAGLPITRVRSAGTDNAIFRLGDELSVRLPRAPSAVEDVAKEHRWLPRLSQALPLAIPVPIRRGVPDEGFPHPWSVYRWLPGEDAMTAPIVDLPDAAVRLGRFVAALRRCDATGAPPSFRGGPIAARDAEVGVTIEVLGADGTIDADVATAVWHTARGAPGWDGPPVWLHADLYPTNLLARQGRLAAVIDFGGLGAGDPACDMLPAWTLFTPATRDLFRAEVQVDQATWVRGRGWALHLGLGAVRVYRVTNPVIGAIGRHALAEVVADFQRTR